MVVSGSERDDRVYVMLERPLGVLRVVLYFGGLVLDCCVVICSSVSG